MEDFWLALVKGALQLFGQYKINQSVMNQQNAFNEQMYNRYSNPEAQARQLKMAGMSDAGIGAALSGFNGAGTTIQSAPMETPQIADLFSDIGQIKTNKLTESEVKINKLTSKQIRKNIEKSDVEIHLLKVKHDISLKEFKVLKHSADYLIDKNDIELKQECVKLSNLFVDLQTSLHNRDITKYNADLSRFKDEFLKKVGVPYDDIETGSPFKIIDILIKLLGGQSIDSYDVFKNYGFDNFNNDVNVYQDTGKYYN